MTGLDGINDILYDVVYENAETNTPSVQNESKPVFPCLIHYGDDMCSCGNFGIFNVGSDSPLYGLNGG